MSKLEKAARELLNCIELHPGGYDYRPYYQLKLDSQLHNTSSVVIRLRQILETEISR